MELVEPVEPDCRTYRACRTHRACNETHRLYRTCRIYRTCRTCSTCRTYRTFQACRTFWAHRTYGTCRPVATDMVTCCRYVKAKCHWHGDMPSLCQCKMPMTWQHAIATSVQNVNCQYCVIFFILYILLWGLLQRSQFCISVTVQ